MIRFPLCPSLKGKFVALGWTNLDFGHSGPEELMGKGLGVGFATFDRQVVGKLVLKKNLWIVPGRFK
jgi:hypothetical protein